MLFSIKYNKVTIYLDNDGKLEYVCKSESEAIALQGKNLKITIESEDDEMIIPAFSGKSLPYENSLYANTLINKESPQ